MHWSLTRDQSRAEQQSEEIVGNGQYRLRRSRPSVTATDRRTNLETFKAKARNRNKSGNKNRQNRPLPSSFPSPSSSIRATFCNTAQLPSMPLRFGSSGLLLETFVDGERVGDKNNCCGAKICQGHPTRIQAQFVPRAAPALSRSHQSHQPPLRPRHGSSTFITMTTDDGDENGPRFR